MYNIVWPHVRSYATKIVELCVTPKDVATTAGYGWATASSMLGDLRYHYEITVSGIPPGTAKYWWRLVKHLNLYEASGTSYWIRSRASQ